MNNTTQEEIKAGILGANKAKSTVEDFRKYEEGTEQRVLDHYRDMRTYQTVDFYRRMEQKYSFQNGSYRKLMTIEEAFDELEHYVVRRSRGFLLFFCAIDRCFSFSVIVSHTDPHKILPPLLRTPRTLTWTSRTSSICFRRQKEFVAQGKRPSDAFLSGCQHLTD